MFHCHISYRSRDGGRSCDSSRQYIARVGRFRKRGDVVRVVVSLNMPAWAGDATANVYWASAEGQNSRANARTALMIEFALPLSLSKTAQEAVARRMAEEVSRLGLEAAPPSHRLPLTFAIHEGFGRNPHVHMMISTSINDQVDRPRESWFNRANMNAPERGGAPRHRLMTKRSWVCRVRALWSRLANEALVSVGLRGNLDHRSYADQGLERAPTIHLGPRLARLAAAGVITPRIARNKKAIEENEALAQAEAELAKRKNAVIALELQADLLEHARAVWKAITDNTLHALLGQHQLAGGARDLRSAATVVVVEADATNNQMLRDSFAKLVEGREVNAVAGMGWDVVKPPQGIWLVRPVEDTVVMLGPGYAATDATDDEGIYAALRLAQQLPFKDPVVMARPWVTEKVEGLLHSLGLEWVTRKFGARRDRKLGL